MATLEAYGADVIGSFGSLNGIVSDKYDATKTYNKGDFCIQYNTLYECNTNNTTGAWNASKWDATTVGEKLKESGIQDILGDDYDDLSQSEKMSGKIFNITDRNAYIPSADMVEYDNFDSGMTATDTQGAIDELNSDLSEKLLGTYSGSTAWDLPEDFRELHVRVWLNAAGLYVENTFLKEDFNQVPTAYHHIVDGWYYTNSNCGMVHLTEANGQAWLGNAIYCGVSDTANCETKVYYR